MTIFRDLEPAIIGTSVASKPRLQSPEIPTGIASTSNSAPSTHSSSAHARPNFAGRRISCIEYFALKVLISTYTRCAMYAVHIFRYFFPNSQQTECKHDISTRSACSSPGKEFDQARSTHRIVHMRSLNPIGETLARLIHPNCDADKFDVFKFTYPDLKRGDRNCRSTNADFSAGGAFAGDIEIHSHPVLTLGTRFIAQYREELSKSEWHFRCALAELAPELISRMQIGAEDGYLLSRFVARLADRFENGLADSDQKRLALLARVLTGEGCRVWQAQKIDKPDQVQRFNRIARQYAQQFPKVYLPLVASVGCKALSFFPSRLWPKDNELDTENSASEFLQRLHFTSAQSLVLVKAALLYTLSLPFCHQRPTLGDIPALVTRHYLALHGQNALEQLGHSLTSAEFSGELQAGKSLVDALATLPGRDRVINSATCALIFATLHSATQSWWADKIGKLMFSYLLTYVSEMTPSSRCLLACALFPIHLLPLAPAVRFCKVLSAVDLGELFEREKFYDALEVADWLPEEEMEPFSTSVPITNAHLLRRLLN